MQPYHFSDGTIRFICLATALLQPDPPSTIIIDEPELGLHPAAISILAELIEAASKNTQVIVATQITKPGQKGGDVRFERVKKDLGMHLKQRPDTYVTLFVDYYGIKSDWPSLSGIRQGQLR
jgi:hypothetical protein